MDNNKTTTISKSISKMRSKSPKSIAFKNQTFHSNSNISKMDKETEHLIKLIDRTSEIYKELIAKNINTSSAYKLPEKLNTLTKSLSKETKNLKFMEIGRQGNLEPFGSNEEKLKMLSLMSICRMTLTSKLSSKRRASKLKSVSFSPFQIQRMSHLRQTSDFSEESGMNFNFPNICKNISKKEEGNINNRIYSDCDDNVNKSSRSSGYYNCNLRVDSYSQSKGRIRNYSVFNKKENEYCIKKLNFNCEDFDCSSNNNYNPKNYENDKKINNNNNLNYFTKQKNGKGNSSLFNNIISKNEEKANSQNTSGNFISFLRLGDTKRLQFIENKNDFDI